MKPLTGLLFPDFVPGRRGRCALCEQPFSADCTRCLMQRDGWPPLTRRELAQQRRHAEEAEAARVADEQRRARLAALGRPVRVGLVGCGKQKRAGSWPARELYTSPLFRLALAEAERSCDEVCVLSALHGLVPLDRVIASYDTSLYDKCADARRGWAHTAGEELGHRFSGLCVELVLYAGEGYAPDWRFFPSGWSWSEPLAGLGIGERLRWLKEQGQQRARE